MKEEEILKKYLKEKICFKFLNKEDSKRFFYNVSNSQFMMLARPLFLLSRECIKDYNSLKEDKNWKIIEFQMEGVKITAPILLSSEKITIKNLYTNEWEQTNFLTGSLIIWAYALKLTIEKTNRLGDNHNEKLIDIFEKNMKLIDKLSKGV